MSDIEDCRKFVENLTRDRGEVMRAGNDKIAEIRERHTMYPPSRPSSSSRYSFIVAYQDIATLLAEVERQRAEIERQRAEIERLRDEDTKTRHALKGWVFVCPDGGDEPTHERVSAVVAEVEKLRAEIERLREALTDVANQETTGPYKWQLVVVRLCEIARETLEDKP